MRRCANQAVERVARKAHLVGEVDLFGREVERLVGRIREQIGEELAYRTMEIDAHDPCEEADLPDHRSRHVHNRLAPLAGVEVRTRSRAQSAAASGVKYERM